MLSRSCLLTLSLLSSVSAQLREAPYSLSLEWNQLVTPTETLSDSLITDLRVSAPLLRNDRLVSALSLSHQRQHYDGDMGFDTLVGSGTSLFILYEFTPGWRLMALNSVRSQHEEGASFSEALTYSGIQGVWREFESGLLLGAGFGYATGITDDTSFFPVLFIDWEFAPHWTLTTRPTPGTRFGPGASLHYAHSDQINLYLGGRYLSQSFLLKDDHEYEYSTTRLFATLQYTYTNNLSLSATVGYNLSGEIRTDDTTTDLAPSPFTALTLSWDF